MSEKLFEGILPQELNKRKRSAIPEFVEPMLATLTDNYFSSDDWIFEHKFDGERCLVFKKNGKVLLKSRNDKIKNVEYPELVTALEKQKADNFVIDGEIITRNKSGLSDFQILQQRINLTQTEKITSLEKTVKISFCIFDIMYVDDYDVRLMPLLSRKKILKRLLHYNDILIYTPHQFGDGLLFFQKACKAKWEGLIAKKSSSIYEGRRSPFWLKFKCIMKQELVIGGYTDPQGSRTGFGALLVGYYKNKRFLFAGKVGTGYSQNTLDMLSKKMKPLEIQKCPFDNYDGTESGVHWLKPKLVAEFQFANWTTGGHLRVGRYKGLRDDKAARDVVKELPKAIVIQKNIKK